MSSFPRSLQNLLRTKSCLITIPIAFLLLVTYWLEGTFEFRLWNENKADFVHYSYGKFIGDRSRAIRDLEVPPALDKDINSLGSIIKANGLQKKPVLVTACDSSHFIEMKDAIASMQSHLPYQEIILYDLGLRTEQIKELKTWCRVQYRKLDFDKYPLHVKYHLYSCSWKPLVIEETLQEYQSVIWFDASVRLLCSNLTQQLQPYWSNGGVVLMIPTGHSNFAPTDPKMFESLPSNMDDMKRLQMYGATVMAINNTLDVYDDVIKWWVRCALNRDCIDPRGSTNMCSFQADRYKYYAKCHRYDQSAINILLTQKHKNDVKKYVMSDQCLRVIRAKTHMYNLKICK